MARVFLSRHLGDAGFVRTVVIKRLRDELSRDPEQRARFVDEARIISRIRHANVVTVIDVRDRPGALDIVLEYIHGVSLQELMRALAGRGERAPLPIVTSLLVGVLGGLEAAHNARTATGEPLHVVHRDVTPRNVMIGVEGVVKLIDFGISRSAGREVATRSGMLLGTPYHIAPEQLQGGGVDLRTDVFLAGILLWELLTGVALRSAFESEIHFFGALAQGLMPDARDHVPDLSDALYAVLRTALAMDPEDRFRDARSMADALEAAVPAASTRLLAGWVQEVASTRLAERERLLRSVETSALAGSADSGGEPAGSSAPGAADAALAPPAGGSGPSRDEPLRTATEPPAALLVPRTTVRMPGTVWTPVTDSAGFPPDERTVALTPRAAPRRRLAWLAVGLTTTGSVLVMAAAWAFWPDPGLVGDAITTGATTAREAPTPSALQGGGFEVPSVLPSTPVPSGASTASGAAPPASSAATANSGSHPSPKGAKSTTGGASTLCKYQDERGIYRLRPCKR